MHHIQAKILGKLLYAESCNYAALRPDGVESNHFTYHLEQLIKAQLIVKHAKQYTLSPQGLAVVDRLSQEKMVERLQPHIVTAIDLVNAKGETLLFKRNFQPYFHRLGFPLGKTHFEEDVMAAAVRELEEKTGLTGIPLAHRGTAYIEATQAGYTISKVLYHIFHGEVEEALPTTSSHRGSCLWADPMAYEPAALMPGLHAMKRLLQAQPDSLFFTEIVQEL